MKTGNTEQQRYWETRNRDVQSQISQLESESKALGQSDVLRNQIVDTINRMKNAQEGFNQKMTAFNTPDYLKKVKAAYRDLQTAITQYNKAVEAGDASSAA